MKIIFALAFLLPFLSCSKWSTSAQMKTAYLPAKKGMLQHQIKWRGVVRAANRIEIRADRKLRIKSLKAKNFDQVKKGQPLIEVDNSETVTKYDEAVERQRAFELELQSAQLKKDHAAKVVARKKTLSEKGIIAEKEFEDAAREAKVSETEYKAKLLESDKVKKEITEIGAQLKAHTYLSPMDGTVNGLVSTENAQNMEVQAGQLLAVVSDVSSLALWAGVEETFIHRLAVGTKADIKLDTLPGETFRGKVIAIDSTGQSTGRIKTYEVGFALGAEVSSLREGFGGEVTVTFAEKDQVVAIPLAAMKYSDGKSFALVASREGGNHAPRELQLGLKTESEVEVVSGLTAGDYVVIENP